MMQECERTEVQQGVRAKVYKDDRRWSWVLRHDGIPVSCVHGFCDPAEAGDSARTELRAYLTRLT